MGVGGLAGCTGYAKPPPLRWTAKMKLLLSLSDVFFFSFLETGPIGQRDCGSGNIVMRLVPHGRDLVSLKNPFFRYFFASKDYIDKGTDRGCHDHGKSLGVYPFHGLLFCS